jgi:hypothetical protein
VSQSFLVVVVVVVVEMIIIINTTTTKTKHTIDTYIFPDITPDHWSVPHNFPAQRRNQEFLRGVGGQQIQLRTEGRENGNLGAVAPWSVVPLNLQMSETRILIRLLWMYFPWNWKFGLALLKLRNFGEKV